jgi:hypothetical protein
MKKLNLEGKKFGGLTAVEPAGDDGYGHARWLFECECGKKKAANVYRVVSGKTASCGCKRVDVTRSRMLRHGHAHRAGMSKTYTTWAGMVARCLTPSATGYAQYGGAGVTVCSQWLDFETFLADMGEAPAGMTIDRIRNEKGYEPGNCRWATRQEQNENRRSVRVVEFNGESMNLTQWARKLGLSKAAMYERVAKWPIERALSEPKR